MNTPQPKIKRLVRALWRGMVQLEIGDSVNAPMYALVDGKPFWFPDYRGH